MSQAITPTPVIVPAPAGEAHGLALVAHVEAMVALAQDPEPKTASQQA